ncbi:MAG: hypothetical protein ABI855_05420, partial [Bacteroidota bacterium]
MKIQFKIPILPFLIFIFIITETNASNYYWVAGTGKWSDFSTHWATSSGGTTFHNSSPSPSDDVFFDANSFSASGQAVTINQPNVFCRNFSWQSPIAGSNFLDSANTFKLSIFGSAFVSANAHISYNGILSFESTSTGNTLDIEDTLKCNIEFNSPSGGWALAAPLNLQKYIHLINGLFNTNSFPVCCMIFQSDYGTPGRQFLTGNTVFKIRTSSNYSSVMASWLIDSLLVFDGSNTDIYFEIDDYIDTTQIIPTNVVVGFEVKSGKQNYRNMYCHGKGLVNGTNGSFYVYTGIAFHCDRIHLHYLENFNSTGASFGFGGPVFVDSMKVAGLIIGAGGVFFANYDSLYVGYLECREEIYLQITQNIYSNFPKIIADGDADFYGGGLPTPINNINSFGDVFVGGNFYEQNASIQGLNPATFRKCVVIGDGTFTSPNVLIDTLMFNQGHTYTIDGGDTVTTNNQFIAFGAPAFPIQMHSATTGTQAKMIFNQPDVCSDYLYLRDMNAIGTNVIAGANSQNIANNSGWQFIACSVTSNVWPGDANYDLIVNNYDLLNIGLAYGETGPVRTGGSNSYIAQTAANWSNFFNSAVNKKHADCDGNGTVNADDTLAISLNYGITHPARLSSPLSENSAGVPLYFDMPTGNIAPGSMVDIPVYLGTSSYPADSIYGIALTINYDPSFIQAGTMNIDFINSWMITPTNNIHIEKDFSASGNFDLALSRIDHTNSSGYGLIATL